MLSEYSNPNGKVYKKYEDKSLKLTDFTSVRWINWLILKPSLAIYYCPNTIGLQIPKNQISNAHKVTPKCESGVWKQCTKLQKSIN